MFTWDEKAAPSPRPLTQAEHDARHPGKRCRDCPEEVAFRNAIAGLADRTARPRWYERRWVVPAACMIGFLVGWRILPI